MIRATGRLLVLACLLSLAVPASATEISFPLLTGRVVDAADLLDAPLEQDLAADLQAHEDKTGNQIVVVTVKSLHGLDIADYSRKLGNMWEIGQKYRNNGVLFVVAPRERKVRIAVGPGLAEELPDSAAQRILNDVVVPAFQSDAYDIGLLLGARKIIEQLEQRAPESSEGQEAQPEARSAPPKPKPEPEVTTALRDPKPNYRNYYDSSAERAKRDNKHALFLIFCTVGFVFIVFISLLSDNTRPSTFGRRLLSSMPIKPRFSDKARPGDLSYYGDRRKDVDLNFGTEFFDSANWNYYDRCCPRDRYYDWDDDDDSSSSSSRSSSYSSSRSSSSSSSSSSGSSSYSGGGGSFGGGGASGSW